MPCLLQDTPAMAHPHVVALMDLLATEPTEVSPAWRASETMAHGDTCHAASLERPAGVGTTWLGPRWLYWCVQRRYALALTLCEETASSCPVHSLPSNPGTHAGRRRAHPPAAPRLQGVRVEAVRAIPLAPDTLPAVLARARDGSAKVAAAVYGIVAQGVEPQYLTLDQKIALLQDGLRERRKDVAAAAGLLLHAWFAGCCQADPLRVLEEVAPQLYPGVAGQG